MAITVTERAESGSWGSDGGTLLYVVTGTADKLEAQAALEAEAPAAVGGMVRDKVGPVEPVADPTETETWTAAVTYREGSRGGRLALGSVTIAGRAGLGTMHITHALEHLGDYAAGTPPNFGGVIGVGGEGGRSRVEGCDIAGPASMTFSVTKVYASGSYPDLDALLDLAGLVNDAVFEVEDTETGLALSFAAGECRYDGFTFGRARGDGGLEITHELAASRDATNLVIESPAGEITVASKPAFAHLWVRYDDYWDAEAELLLQVAFSAHVETVYDAGSFTALAL